MKNKEKFQTLEEMEEAFSSFCRRKDGCHTCPLVETNHCSFAWLELEAETSKDMISDLIEKVPGLIIGEEEANRLRIEMLTKLLSHREVILEIWKAQDKETTDEK